MTGALDQLVTAVSGEMLVPACNIGVPEGEKPRAVAWLADIGIADRGDVRSASAGGSSVTSASIASILAVGIGRTVSGVGSAACQGSVAAGKSVRGQQI